jgi:hypothetical protein
MPAVDLVLVGRIFSSGLALVNKWRDDNPGISNSGNAADGFPADPLRPWNRGG